MGVVAGDIVGKGASEQRAVLGETPNLAARLQGLAPPNSVVIAEATQRLVEGRFELETLMPRKVKGLREPVRAYQARAIRATSRFEAATARGLSTFVGRQDELQLLLARWDQAKAGEGQADEVRPEAADDERAPPPGDGRTGEEQHGEQGGQEGHGRRQSGTVK